MILFEKIGALEVSVELHSLALRLDGMCFGAGCLELPGSKYVITTADLPKVQTETSGYTGHYYSSIFL